MPQKPVLFLCATANFNAPERLTPMRPWFTLTSDIMIPRYASLIAPSKRTNCTAKASNSISPALALIKPSLWQPLVDSVKLSPYTSKHEQHSQLTEKSKKYQSPEKK